MDDLKCLDYAPVKPKNHWRWVLGIYAAHTIVVLFFILLKFCVLKWLQASYGIHYFDMTPGAATIYDRFEKISIIVVSLSTIGGGIAFLVKIAKKKLSLIFLPFVALMLFGWFAFFLMMGFFSYDAYL
ncbi:MAG TPA: hypothetical protein VGN88_07145 [Phycisphaerae bacterium]